MTRLSDSVKDLRNAVMNTAKESEPIDEGRRVKVKKTRGLEKLKKKKKSKQYREQHSGELSRKSKLRRKSTEFKRAKAEIERLGPPKKGVRRVTNKSLRKMTAPIREDRDKYDAWIKDVNEAVDMFIGMPMNVLPKLPWRKWYESGASAVMAAKNAIHMVEDLDEDELPDGDEDLDELEEEDDDSMLTYEEWHNEVNIALKENGKTFGMLRKEYKIKSPIIHDWYNSGHEPRAVAEALIAGPPKKKQEAKETPGKEKPASGTGSGMPSIKELASMSQKVEKVDINKAPENKISEEVLGERAQKIVNLGETKIEEVDNSNVLLCAMSSCDGIAEQERRERAIAIEEAKREEEMNSTKGSGESDSGQDEGK